MQMRRFSFAQVTLYLGAWILVIGAFLFTLYEYEKIPRLAPILLDAAATFGAGFLGMRLWSNSDRKRAVPVLLPASPFDPDPADAACGAVCAVHQRG